MPRYGMYAPRFIDGKSDFTRGMRVRYIVGPYAGKIGRIVARQFSDVEAYSVRLEKTGEHIISIPFSFLRVEERSDTPWKKPAT